MQWQKLYDSSPFNATKAIAATSIAIKFCHQLPQECEKKVEQTDFDKLFQKFDTQAVQAEKKLNDLPHQWKLNFQTRAKYSVSHFKGLLIRAKNKKPERFNNDNSYDKTRLKKSNDRVQKFKEAIDAVVDKD